MMTIEEEMILNRVATALETIARQKMGAEPVKADEELEDVYADEVLEWMDKFPSEMRDCIRTTAYHFFQLGVEWQKKRMMKKAIGWIKWNNDNGGCLFDGWQDDFIKAMED